MQISPKDRRLFRETFETFRSKDATGLSAEGRGQGHDIGGNGQSTNLDQINWTIN